ncbi:MAG: DMT family transporter [Verrucomicrobia bacterium]|nr:DMT family transporter [Verrucomicrobiota bacterium]
MLRRLPSSWLVFLSLLIAIIGWGWAWVGIRYAIRYYAPGQLAFGRYLVASMTLLPFWIARGRHFPKSGDWFSLIVMGVTGFTIYNFCINVGEQTITAGTAALIGAFLPIGNTLGAAFFLNEKLSPTRLTGILIAFAGVAVTSLGAQGHFEFSFGAFLVFIAVLSASVYGVLTKYMVKSYPPLDVVSWAMWAGTLGLLPLGHGLVARVQEVPWLATLNVILLGILPGAMCYACFTFALSRVPVAKASTSMFFMPITSILLGWLLLGELPSSIAIAGGVVTIMGAYIVNTKR